MTSVTLEFVVATKTFQDAEGNVLDTSKLDPTFDLDSVVRRMSSSTALTFTVKLTRLNRRKGLQRIAIEKVVQGSQLGLLPSYFVRSEESVATPQPEVAQEQVVPAANEVMNFIHTEAVGLRPETLVMSDIKWKFLLRSILRGNNIMMTGPAGCGKTFAAKAAREALSRPDFYFNLGATQDPRSALIGNTHFSKESGTFFTQSLFVQAIQTPNAVILLDEVSRAHPDAWNILMTVLDQGQRYLRLDEHPDTPTIKVAEGVSFIGTANIGHEYTSTRSMDRALMDRFSVIEVDVLDKDQEQKLIQQRFPNLAEDNTAKIAEIVADSRAAFVIDALTSAISTRTSLEVAALMVDGFSLEEAAEVTIYPQYTSTGGVDSERTYIKQIVQKCINVGADENLFNANQNNNA